MISIALAKGRLAKDGLELFKSIGIDCPDYSTKSRKLIFFSSDERYKFIMVKPSDVPIYVERGAADIGIVGKDTLLEEGKDVYELLDLKFASCKMSVAGFPDEKKRSITNNNIRVATKYPNIARSFFSQRKEMVEIIKLNGSVELGPIIGLSDIIVDIVESGKTLKENGLVVIEDICPITARLIVNRVSLKIKRGRIEDIIKSLEKSLEEKYDD
ncbi:MAG: ATP phosphoribosyltransferase [Clostridiales bacterium]|nr:ATP phosphoribosyltransferase [Clostridiales bacterium]